MRSKKNAVIKGNVPAELSCPKSFFLPKILPPECEMSNGLSRGFREKGNTRKRRRWDFPEESEQKEKDCQRQTDVL